MNTATASGPAPLLSRRFVGAYVVTMRPYLLFLSGAVGLAALALVPDLAATDAIGVGLACFGAYGFGQALTDCFQTDTDALSAPYRPLVRGTVKRRHVLTVSLVGLAGVGAVLVLHEARNVALVAAAIGGLASYTWFKRRPWGGPPWNAAIVLALFAAAHLAGRGAAGGTPEISGPLLAAAGVVFFGYANFVVAGYFKDRRADARTGYRTLPVVAGFRVAAWTSDALAVAAAASVVLAAVRLTFPTGEIGLARSLDPATAAGTGLGFGLLGLGLAASAVGQLRLHRVRRDSDAHRAVAPVLDALVFALIGLAGVARPDWAPWLVAYAALYRWSLHRRPAAAQI